MGPLFADGAIGPWGAAAIGTGIGTAVTAASVFVVRYFRGKGEYVKDEAEARVKLSAEGREVHREQEEAERKQESAILKEYKALVEAQKREREDDRKLVHTLRDEMAKNAYQLALCRIGRAKADERIAALEEALTEAGIPLKRRWNPESPDGSGPHAPLQGDGS